MYPRAWDQRHDGEQHFCFLTWICFCQTVRTVNFARPFTTSVPISISILQTFRSWVATSHLRPLMAFYRTTHPIRQGLFLFWMFILRAIGLFNKLLRQWYVEECLKSSLRKFYGRYGDLIKQYEVPLSQTLHDILKDDHIQWQPPLIRHYTNFWPCYWSRPYYRIWIFT